MGFSLKYGSQEPEHLDTSGWTFMYQPIGPEGRITMRILAAGSGTRFMQEVLSADPSFGPLLMLAGSLP